MGAKRPTEDFREELLKTMLGEQGKGTELEREHPGGDPGHPRGEGVSSAPEAGAASWEDALPRYRTSWEERHGARGRRWEEDEPYYRYGWEMANDPRYRGRAFTEVEPELRRGWESRHPDWPWGRAADRIRDAWEAVTGGAGTATEGGPAIQLREEEIVPRKQMVEAGEAEVRKEVLTETRTIDVPVRREELVIENRPGAQPAERASGAGETTRIPLREEEVTVDKRPVVYEEVRVGKRQVQETERVSDTVRREEARIEREGDVEVRGDEPRRRS